ITTLLCDARTSLRELRHCSDVSSNQNSFPTSHAVWGVAPGPGILCGGFVMANRNTCLITLFITALIALAFPYISAAQADTNDQNALIQLLVTKGVLTSDDASALNRVAAAQQHGRLLELLRDKGVISADEFTSLAPASTQVSGALVASMTAMVPAVEPTKPVETAKKPEAPKFIPAVAPIRVLQLEPSKPNGL